MKTQQPQIYRRVKGSPTGEIQSYISVFQKIKTISGKQSNFTFKGTTKRTTNKSQGEQNKGNNKYQR